MKIWTIQTSKLFEKQIKSLEINDKKRILAYLKKRVSISDNPKQLAKPLSGNLRGYWRFRVGNYRIITDIQEQIFTIVAIEVNNGKDIYN
jgi:mRNA interferase RelE/StbE